MPATGRVQCRRRTLLLSRRTVARAPPQRAREICTLRPASAPPLRGRMPGVMLLWRLPPAARPQQPARPGACPLLGPGNCSHRPTAPPELLPHCLRCPVSPTPAAPLQVAPRFQCIQASRVARARVASLPSSRPLRQPAGGRHPCACPQARALRLGSHRPASMSPCKSPGPRNASVASAASSAERSRPIKVLQPSGRARACRGKVRRAGVI